MNILETVQSRRVLLGTLALTTIGLASGAYAVGLRAMKVWKDPNCGCCGGWVEHIRRNGITPLVTETSNVDTIKTRFGVPRELASCHTAQIAGYVIEGHVPALAILRLLESKPKVLGLAVPGMPIGSPGMEGGTPEVYNVIVFSNGTRTSFGRYKGDQPV